jgi:hypothetical protein
LAGNMARLAVDPDDDDSGQVELLADFLQGSSRHCSAAATLRQMADDADVGMPRAVLETVADMVQTVAGDSDRSYVQARLVPIDWDTAAAGDAMLYVQRSSNKLRSCRLMVENRDRDSCRGVSVQFDRCGAVKHDVYISSLYGFDESLVDLPCDYAIAYPTAGYYWSQWTQWMQADDSQQRAALTPVDGLAQRRLNVRYFSLKKKVFYLHLPTSMRHNKADHKTFHNLWEQQRQGKVFAFKQQRRDGELSALQQRLAGVHTPASMRAIWAERRREVHLTLSDDYLKARVGALRRWSWNCIAVYSVGPWRIEVWPAAHDPESEFSEDQISLGFVTESSMRFTTVASCRAAWTHVKEFHITMLGVMPGAHPLTEHFL